MRCTYSDYVEAGWMAKTYGMKLIGHGGRDLEYKNRKFFYQFKDKPKKYANQKYWVNPESFELFEPQVGDLCISRDYMEDGAILKAVYIADEEMLKQVGAGMKIIERKGVIFFWPKVEPDKDVI